LEDTDPEHAYKYFPNQDEWTWKQQLGFEDLGMPRGHGPLSGGEHGHDGQEVKCGWQQVRGVNRDRDNGWPTRMSTQDPGARGDDGEQGTVRAPSRQRRLDEFPTTAPRGIPYSHQAYPAP